MTDLRAGTIELNPDGLICTAALIALALAADLILLPALLLSPLGRWFTGGEEAEVEQPVLPAESRMSA